MWIAGRQSRRMLTLGCQIAINIGQRMTTTKTVLQGLANEAALVAAFALRAQGHGRRS